jgi:hypothetical protein
LVPIAAFLAGALLSILLPVGLLIVLSVWYWVFSLRVPATADKGESRADPATATPGPNTPQNLPHDPGH